MKILTISLICLVLLAYFWTQVEGQRPDIKQLNRPSIKDLRGMPPLRLRSGLVLRGRSGVSKEAAQGLGDLQRSQGTLTPVPVLDEKSGRWFFDWFWGPDPGDYPPPPMPLPPGPPPPLYPPHVPPPMHEPLEYCTQIMDPITHDIIEDCYPIYP